MQALCSAGVSPAIFPISTHCENAGETSELQQIARAKLMHDVLPKPESLVRYPG